MSSESTYQPNFVLNEEEKVSTEGQELEESLKPALPESIEINEQFPNILIDREVEFIDTQRCKLRLFDPKGVYFNRHVTISYFHSVVHIISLLISISLIMLLLIEGTSISNEFVQGIGLVSNATVFDTATSFIVFFIFTIQFRSLIDSQSGGYLNRYKLAMLANSINLALLNHMRLFVFTLALGVLGVWYFEGTAQEGIILELTSNGVVSDIIDALFNIISIFIVGTSLRFCSKEIIE